METAHWAKEEAFSTIMARSVVEVKQKKVRRTRIGVNAKSRVVLEFFFDVWAVSLSKQVL